MVSLGLEQMMQHEW